MPKDLGPEDVLGHLDKGRLSPFYLFFGQSEFLLEKVLTRIRETFIPESSRDFNLQVFYGDETGKGRGDIIDAARSLPFLSENRLIIVRRTEKIPASALENFIPYLESPAESTCLIFVSAKPDFRWKFYKKIRKLHGTVNFRPLYSDRVVPWIKNTAKDLGLNMNDEACAYLLEIVGNRLRDLYSELEKIYLRYGERSIGMGDVKEIAIYSRIYTVFELMDQVSMKQRAGALSVLKRYLEEEGGRVAQGKLIGMLNRQILLLFRTRAVLERGGRRADVARKLGLRDFQVKQLMPQSRHWSADQLERALRLLYEADGLLKSGSDGHLVLENLVLSLSG